ncbi:sarcosine oxidase subunit gamma [Litoreibacter roseus]|uniref:Uncharacterized protein n=1 Tax=Litoreibacter roseus TaxID=2601869 RepID=A0A6N6JDZ4_9RHOB|nr:sarcosine oxidase subunit gamma [Litoreibacter roseus]GFE63498.1 hypothetical protein KIN_05720 [Litoreibacter roseus]
MVELVARTPCEGLLPYEAGEAELSEIIPKRITSLAPFEDSTLLKPLKTALGVELPAPGQSVKAKDGRIVWTGQNQFFVLDAEVPALDAAVTDQSDAWAMVALGGAAAIDVMARICPLDCAHMTASQVARSLIGHMPAIIIRTKTGFEIMVFRAFAKTLVNEVSHVMDAVAARGALST